MTATIKKTVAYPTVGMVIDEILENEPDREIWDEDTVSIALTKWDAQFADDPDWNSVVIGIENDIRDELRFEVENVLGLEF